MTMLDEPRRIPDPGFKICGACSGSRKCQVCGGTMRAEEGGPCMACDYGRCDLCHGTGQLPMDWQPSDADPQGITLEQGNENAPDSPWGYQRVRVTMNGELEYEHRERGRAEVIRGLVDPTRVSALRAALGRTNFPVPPQTSFLPGSSVVILTVSPPLQRVLIDYFDGLKVDGYREVIRELSGLNDALRESQQDVLATWNFVPTAKER